MQPTWPEIFYFFFIKEGCPIGDYLIKKIHLDLCGNPHGKVWIPICKYFL